MKKQNRIGTLLDWTREEDDSPFYGVVAYDEDLGFTVVNRTNGGFIYLNDPEMDSIKRVIDKSEIKAFLSLEKERFPDEDFTYIEKLSNPIVLKKEGII